jgi:hypothetical protein
MKSLSRSSLLRVILLFLSTAGTALSQIEPRATISGSVLDDSTSVPLENVDVFIANTTLGCSTDQNGRFEIKNIPPGSYQVVASRVGYTVWSGQVGLWESGRREIAIRLRSAAVNVGEVVISAPEPTAWRKQLERFVQLFLGTTQNASECKILNPQVLDFEEKDGIFSATARAPLEIDNLALGYHLQFFLARFNYGKVTPPGAVRAPTTGEILVYEGLPKYTELKASAPGEMERWTKNRLRAFKGSLRHFLASLVRKELKKEGFGISMSHHYLAGEDDIVFDGSEPEDRTVRFRGTLQVIYTREPVEAGYDLTKDVSVLSRQPSWKVPAAGQISWLSLNWGAITVNARGLIKEWFPTRVGGYWAWERVADALPLDYEPELD